MKKLKYVSNINTEKNYAEMYIYDEIGFDGIKGSHFAHELRYLTDYHEPKISNIKVRINSVGGSILEAFSIFSAIYNANKSKKVKITTHNDGVAASSAGFILMAAGRENIYMKDYSSLMLHGLSLLNEEGEKVEVDEASQKSLDIFKEMIKTLFKNNTSVDEAQLEELLTNGTDNWFTAKEAAMAGFMLEENIENTGLEIDLPEVPNAKIIANKAQKIINKHNLIPLKMKRVINLLKLQEGANEEVVANAVENALKQKKDATEALALAQNKLTEKDNEINELKEKVQAANKVTAVAFVDAAIKDGKFAPKNETEKETLVNQAVANPEAFKQMVEMMPTKSAKVTNQLSPEGDESKTLIERINNRSLRQLEKEEPALLAEVRNKAKGVFVNLWNAQYGTNKTEEDFK